MDCGPTWVKAAMEAAVARGPQTSALLPDARHLIMEEVDYQVAAGFSQIFPWADVQKLCPSQLKMSPLAVIPQVGRRGRLLSDLSFAVHAPQGKGKRACCSYTTATPLAPSVNDTTKKLSPDYPIKELGRVLLWLLWFMAKVPAEETIMFAKIDLSDGFWRMLVAEDQQWNFAYTLPGAVEPPRIVVPHALQMGWTESPGYFCAATETGWDITQALIDGGILCPPTHVGRFHGAKHLGPSTDQPRDSSPVADVGGLCRRLHPRGGGE